MGHYQRALVLGFCAALLGLMAPALAEERIISFDSDVTVAADGELTVTETIKVQAEGYDIKRGIYRDFPTVYKGRDGETHIVGFSVVEVLRGGKRENWFTKKMSNGVRVYIGEKDYRLPRGEYTYRLTYKTDRQIAFHEDFDELYWNVTGNGWTFPIDYASVTVHLPEDATVVRKSAYTGPQNARGTAWTYATDGSGNPMFATTSRLSPYEGLTVAIAFPKGFVAPPSQADELLWGLRAYAGYVAAGLIWLFILGFYVFVWSRVGRDPEKGTIVPRWRPPAGISPAAARFVTEMGFDSKAISAAIVSLAVKGKLIIEDDGDDEYRLRRNDKGFGLKLSPGEKALDRALFMWSDSASISDGNHERLKPAVDALKSALSANFEGAHFRRNRGWFALGVALSFVSLIFMGPSMAMAGAQKVPIPLFVAIGGLVLLNWLFFMLLKAPTMKAARSWTRSRASKCIWRPPSRAASICCTRRSARRNCSRNTCPTPWRWTSRTNGANSSRTCLPPRPGGDEGGYHPTGITGRHGYGRWSSPGGFASNLGSSIGSSISSAATPPSSSTSGSGGGGSSGGGGGGGGGGGW